MGVPGSIPARVAASAPCRDVTSTLPGGTSNQLVRGVGLVAHALRVSPLIDLVLEVSLENLRYATPYNSRTLNRRPLIFPCSSRSSAVWARSQRTATSAWKSLILILPMASPAVPPLRSGRRAGRRGELCPCVHRPPPGCAWAAAGVCPDAPAAGPVKPSSAAHPGLPRYAGLVPVQPG